MFTFKDEVGTQTQMESTFVRMLSLKFHYQIQFSNFFGLETQNTAATEIIRVIACTTSAHNKRLKITT